MNRVYEEKAGRREPACLSPAEESCLQELFLRGVEKVGMPTEITAESLIAVLRARARCFPSICAGNDWGTHRACGARQRGSVRRSLWSLCVD